MHNVTLITQATPELCWEACARMMWLWRNRTLAGYAQKAGAFANRNTGLTQAEMDRFNRGLGMRSFASPKVANLKHALTFSPVMIVLADKKLGHALVAKGTKNNAVVLANPCLTEFVDFDSGVVSCTGGDASVPIGAIERSLGSYIWYW